MEAKAPRRILKLLVAAILLLAIGGGALMLYGRHQRGKIPGLSFSDALAYTTRDNPEAIITVGIVQDGIASFTVYGENGQELPQEAHAYEIGSLTKTFTAALIRQAADEGLLAFEDTIDTHLDLPEGSRYPSIASLLTHTSGYKGYYFESPMIGNFFRGRNSFRGITKAMVLDRVGKLHTDGSPYPFDYSNFGYAVLGLVLEAVYETDYRTLIGDYLRQNLELEATTLSDGRNDLPHHWDWEPDDAYLAAGGLISTIDDMLRYAEGLLETGAEATGDDTPFVAIDGAPAGYESMGIHMDAVGMAWIWDETNRIVWHNGGTGHYNSYLGFDPETDTAVVVLSNLPPNARIPATILGIKRMQELRP